MPHPFLTTWANWRPRRPPYFLPADAPILDGLRRDLRHCHSSWRRYVRSHDFGVGKDAALHLGLLPQPFFGDPNRARVVILTLNPGVGPHDYFGEYETPGLRRALLSSLRNPTNSRGFLFLDPRFSWHGGFAYWHGRLKGVIEVLAHRWKLSIPDAHRKVASSIATLELLPYHSSRFGLPKGVLRDLPSVQLARSFAREVLLPRAKNGECLIIMARSAVRWGLKPGRNILVYSGSEARAAFLTPQSRGGRAIVRFLERSGSERGRP